MATLPLIPVPQFTNDTLAHGLVIEHKKVYTEKCKWELLRCPKCHRWGHIVANCEAPKDICGTCALQHHTAMCTNGENPWCVSCKVSGHSSWDRRCPIFQQKCHELNEKIDDNSMPYFPTHKTWTQVMELPWSALISQNKVQGAPPTNRPVQSTLNWQQSMPTSSGAPPSPCCGAAVLLQQRSWDHDDYDDRDGLPHYHPHFYE